MKFFYKNQKLLQLQTQKKNEEWYKAITYYLHQHKWPAEMFSTHGLILKVIG